MAQVVLMLFGQPLFSADSVWRAPIPPSAIFGADPVPARIDVGLDTWLLAQAGRGGGQGSPKAARSVVDGGEHGRRLVIVGIGDHCIMPPLVIDR